MAAEAVGLDFQLRRSHPVGLTEVSGSSLKALGSSGARFGTAVVATAPEAAGCATARGPGAARGIGAAVWMPRPPAVPTAKPAAATAARRVTPLDLGLPGSMQPPGDASLVWRAHPSSSLSETCGRPSVMGVQASTHYFRPPLVSTFCATGSLLTLVTRRPDLQVGRVPMQRRHSTPDLKAGFTRLCDRQPTTPVPIPSKDVRHDRLRAAPARP